MIQINPERCMKCGLCVQDCFPGALTMEQGKPVLTYPDRCLACGHCIAVCPGEAVVDDCLDCTDLSPVLMDKDPQQLLLMMKSRRSCRHYKGTPMSREELNMLLDAARYCPTAKNLQSTRFIAVTDAIPQLLNGALEGLGKLGQVQRQTASDSNEIRRAENFIAWAEKRRTDKNFDPLFFHAPLLLCFVAEGDPRDAAASAAYTELMASAMGLGCLYSGYFTACAAADQNIQQLLHLQPGETLVRCLVLGHPDVKFRRTVPRKPANLTML